MTDGLRDLEFSRVIIIRGRSAHVEKLLLKENVLYSLVLSCTVVKLFFPHKSE